MKAGDGPFRPHEMKALHESVEGFQNGADNRWRRWAPILLVNPATDGRAHFARVELFAGALVPVDAVFFIHRLIAMRMILSCLHRINIDVRNGHPIARFRTLDYVTNRNLKCWYFFLTHLTASPFLPIATMQLSYLGIAQASGP